MAKLLTTEQMAEFASSGCLFFDELIESKLMWDVIINGIFLSESTSFFDKTPFLNIWLKTIFLLSVVNLTLRLGL